MDYEKIWESVLEIVKEIIPKISFETWLLPLKIRKIDENLKIAYIEVNSGDRNDLIIGRIDVYKRQVLCPRSVLRTEPICEN